MLLGELWSLLGEVDQQVPPMLHNYSVPTEGWEVFSARPRLKFQGGKTERELSPHFLCNFTRSKLKVPDSVRLSGWGLDKN